MDNRNTQIYMFAIDASMGTPTADLSWFDPPLTKIEKAYYDKLYAEITEENAKAAANGRKIVWDIPFDP